MGNFSTTNRHDHLFTIPQISQSKKRRVIDEAKKKYPNGTYIFATAVEDIGDDLIQFYGDVHGGDIVPNMSLSIPSHGEYKVYEVYAADETPDKPNSKLTNGSRDVAIVIKSPKLDCKSISKEIKNQKVIAIPIIN